MCVCDGGGFPRQKQEEDQINGGMIMNYFLAGEGLEEKDKSRPHAAPLTAWRLLTVNYGALEHTFCPRDPLVTNKRERGEKNKNKKVSEK